MVSEPSHRVRSALAMLQPGALALRPFRCPICGPTLLLRLASEPIGVRCMRCAASAIHLSLVSVLQSVRPGFGGEAVYELSAHGPLFKFLKKRVPALTSSEHFDDVPPGGRRDGVLCQDVQHLTFPDGSFDICTSTEVFEHVPDDARGFREIQRVLRPGGIFVLTVPLAQSQATVERARVRDGRVEHLLPPVYHGDRLRGRGQVLVFRDYGHDIAARLRDSGFAETYIDGRFETAFLGQGCGVVVAKI